MRRLTLALFIVLACGCAFGQTPPATIPVTGTKAIDNTNSPLTGNLIFTVTDITDTPVAYTPQGGTQSSLPITVTVVNGAIQNSGGYPPTIPNPVTMSPANTRYRIQATSTNGSTIFYTLPLTNVNTPSFTMDSYNVPPNVVATGIGRPMIACAPGAQYAQVDQSYAYNWVCSQLRSDQSIYWTQNPYLPPNTCPQPRMAFVSNRFGAPFCVDSLEAFATANMIVGNSSTAPGALSLIPYTPGTSIPPTTILLKGTTSGGAIPASPSDVGTLLASLSGCADTTKVYSPAAGQCVAPGVSAPGAAQQTQTTDGAGHLTATPQTIDPLTGNTYTPGVIATSGGVTSTASNCAQAVGGGVVTCDLETHNFSQAASATGATNFATSGTASFYGGGVVNAFNYEAVSNVRETWNINCNQVSVCDDQYITEQSWALGDKFVRYAYINGAFAASHASDEGTGVNASQAAETPSNMSGAILSYNSTTHRMTVQPTGNNQVVDGSVITDISSAQVTTGNLTAASVTMSDMPLVKYLTAAGSSLPLTTARAILTTVGTDVFNQNAPAGTYQSVTATFNLLPVGGTLVNGVVTGGTYAPLTVGWVRVGAQKDAEIAQITAVGPVSSNTQSVTLSVHGGTSGSQVTLWQGGIYDDVMSLTAEDNISGFRHYHPILGSITGTDIQYAEPAFGQYGQITLPLQPGIETVDGGTFSAFSLYHSAAILRVNNAPHAHTANSPDFTVPDFTIEATAHNWSAAGTVVENPRYPEVAMKVDSGFLGLATFCNPSTYCTTDYRAGSGPALSGSMAFHYVENPNPLSMYIGGGGTGRLTAPFGYFTKGAVHELFYSQNDPLPDSLGNLGCTICEAGSNSQDHILLGNNGQNVILRTGQNGFMRSFEANYPWVATAGYFRNSSAAAGVYTGSIVTSFNQPIASYNLQGADFGASNWQTYGSIILSEDSNYRRYVAISTASVYNPYPSVTWLHGDEFGNVAIGGSVGTRIPTHCLEMGSALAFVDCQGNFGAANGVFTGTLSGVTASFSGALSATSGSITGNLGVGGSIYPGNIGINTAGNPTSSTPVGSGSLFWDGAYVASDSTTHHHRVYLAQTITGTTTFVSQMTLQHDSDTLLNSFSFGDVPVLAPTFTSATVNGAGFHAVLYAPASSSAAGKAGDIAWGVDASGNRYIYVCFLDNPGGTVANAWTRFSGNSF